MMYICIGKISKEQSMTDEKSLKGVGGIFAKLIIALLAVAAQAQERSLVWNPDRGDGTYVNPVINADYSDPDACAVGDDYYLTASSFNCIPGLPVLHSNDLVHWRIVGHALQELLPREVFASVQHGKGVWAPAIRHHNGRFRIYWGDPDRGIMTVSSEKAEGPWSTPVCVVEGRGMIDPCPLWDDDGRCYLVNAWAASRVGFNSVLTVRELSADGLRAIGDPRIVFDGGQENHTAEGPKFYKREGWYWIMCPAGGVARGWQLAMRSRSPYGPYEWRRTLEQGQTDINGPHQGAWVHTPYGEDWFLHFNDRGARGRVVYLEPVDWQTGWPVMGRGGEPVAACRKPRAREGVTPCNPQESDEFNGTMGPQWQWQANRNPLWGMPTADGAMRLYTMEAEGQRSLWDASNLLLQKMPAERFTATTLVRLSAKEDGQEGGLVVMGRDCAALGVRRVKDGFRLVRRTCIGADRGRREKEQAIARLEPSSRDTIPYSPALHLRLWLRVEVTDGICRFAYSTDGVRFLTAGEPFTLKEGKWIGAKTGLYAVRSSSRGNRGWLDADWWRVTPAEATAVPGFDAGKALDYCAAQIRRALRELSPIDASRAPRNILRGETHWNLRPVKAEEWCSGFWPGILWMDYIYTREENVRKAAEQYTEAVTPIVRRPVFDHDLGFIVINSLLKGYEATGRRDYKALALEAADSLAGLYNPRVGTLLSWPRHVKDYGGHNTIMDNMMNLELLLWAADNGGSRRLRDIAVSHAVTTMRHHFRPDGSSYHVAVYDTLTGRFIRGVTHQGYSDASMWSRGQSWAVYGYTMVYRFTREKRFLDFACKVADIYLKRLRETSDDGVPLWDMDDPRGLGAPKDASAACVVASALLELDGYVPSRGYRAAALSMLADLSTERYQSRSRNAAFLLHSTGHHPAGSEIDAGIVYADYYYIEALLRSRPGNIMP